MGMVWAWLRQAKGELVGVAAIAVVVTLVVILLASRGAGSARGSGSRIAHATATPAATNTPTATDTPAPTPTATHPPAPTPTATWGPFSGKVIRVTASVSWLTGKVSVSCPAGTTLVGGGEDDGYGSAGYNAVESSYPSSHSTWTVYGGQQNVPYSLTAIADCLQTSASITTTIIPVTSAVSITATGGVQTFVYRASCPSGVITGGGFEQASAGYEMESYPDGANDWEFVSEFGAIRGYIICASAPIVERVNHVTITYPLYAGTGPDHPTETAVSCPSGYTPLSGGFGEPSSSVLQIGSGTSELSSSGQSWIVWAADRGAFPHANVASTYILCGELA